MKPKITFNEFRETMKIDSNIVDSATVGRALEMDADLFDLELHNDIVQLILAVRKGRGEDVAFYAKAIADEYQSLTEVEEFACNPVDELRALMAPTDVAH